MIQIYFHSEGSESFIYCTDILRLRGHFFVRTVQSIFIKDEPCSLIDRHVINNKLF